MKKAVWMMGVILMMAAVTGNELQASQSVTENKQTEEQEKMDITELLSFIGSGEEAQNRVSPSSGGEASGKQNETSSSDGQEASSKGEEISGSSSDASSSESTQIGLGRLMEMASPKKEGETGQTDHGKTEVTGESEAKPETKSETEGKTETKTETKSEAKSEAVSESESESESEMESETENHEIEPIAGLCEQMIIPRENLGEHWAVCVAVPGQDGKDEMEMFSYHGKDVMQSASVIKVFIMGAVYDRICYPSSEEKTIYYAENYEGELRQLLEQMIRVSDNNAANRLIEILGEEDFRAGAAVVNDFCREHGYLQTSVGRRFLESNPTGDNYVSAHDCTAILSAILNGKLVNEEASSKMLDILKGQSYTWKIPAGLPEGFSSANKTGEMPEGYGLGCIENDIAIVFSGYGNYVISILSNDLGGRNNEAQRAMIDMSQYVAYWFREKMAENMEADG